MLAVADAGKGRPRVDVSLIAANAPLVGTVLEIKTAVLNAAVAANDFVVKAKIKVTGLAPIPDDEGVAYGRVFLGGFASNRSLAII